MNPEPRLHPPLAGAGRRPGWRFLRLASGAPRRARLRQRPVADRARHRRNALGLARLRRLRRRSSTTSRRAAVIVVAIGVGWWACTVTARDLDQADPSAVVWDEVVAFWLVLWLVTPASLTMQAVAFVLFRVFDAAKPGPVAWADQRFKRRRGEPIGWAQGFGILFDDFVAALCTLLVIAVWRFV